MANRWILQTVWTALFICTCFSPACALNVIEQNKFYIYYPDKAGELAARLSRQVHVMADFLKTYSLPVSLPIHIIIDNELDSPKVEISLYPHREIRLPIRAPGILEDGYTEPDPWRYFLFKGLCTQGIYTERSGLPGSLYWIFGEIISPNLILPDWTIDGISHLLYEQFTQRPVHEPLSRTIFKATPVPDLDKVSNHPEIWPGRFSYRIYGRPFIRWLYQRYGWKKILDFLQRHGRGIVPLEIDIKARLAFGLSWNQIWGLFQAEHNPKLYEDEGFSINGYWDSPFVYWNAVGVYPGVATDGQRGRYGFVDSQDWLWLSQYTDKASQTKGVPKSSGVSQIKLLYEDIVRTLNYDHVWDPGPGAVAVSRHGLRPHLVLFDARKEATLFAAPFENIPIKKKIEPPTDVVQLSGPVMDEKGRIAVAANIEGNWDIWLYDGSWHRMTDAPSIEMDPLLTEDKLIFCSNISGTFQLHGVDMTTLTSAPVAAMLPRGRSHLTMRTTGWRLSKLDTAGIPVLPPQLPPAYKESPKEEKAKTTGQPYSVFKSIWPNQIAPDIYIDSDQFQFGLSTAATDVSQAFAWNAGIRYDTDESQITWRFGWRSPQISTRATRYPFYYETQRQIEVDEDRIEVMVAWSPLRLKELSFSANWREYTPEETDLDKDEWWAGIDWKDTMGRLDVVTHLELFDDDSQSLYGSLLYCFGKRTNTLIKLEAGKTWGDLNTGHNTFRIGGYSSEGDFTRRPSRLIPLRGFDDDTLDAGKYAVASLEVILPFAKLQTGYKTLPLFLHNISLGTFVDAGFADDEFNSDEILVGAGFELITGMELAWGSMSDFRVGIAWPLEQPDDFDGKGPVVLIQIGNPL